MTPNTIIEPTFGEFETLQTRFAFFPKNGAQYPRKGVIISRQSEGKVRVLIAISEAGLRLSTTDFFDVIMRQYGVPVDDLTQDSQF